MDRNILLTIAYDGSVFHGWQRQPGMLTVQGHLENTFSSLFGREIRIEGTSRTDAGVHALGQRATMRGDLGIPEDRLVRVLNNALCGREEGREALSPVRILEAKDMPEGFHARFDSKGKKYIYRIRASENVDVFSRNYIWHARQALDVGAMRRAAEYLTGTHDFKSFESSGGNPRQTTVRTIYEAVIRSGRDEPRGGSREIVGHAETPQKQGSREITGTAEAPQKQGNREIAGICLPPMLPDEIRVEVSGDGFLYNMVRIITGTLAEIGAGKRAPEEMREIIEAADRSKAGLTAPPYGLYLMEVYYG